MTTGIPALDEMLEMFRQQSDLNAAISKALQAFALTSDRYDDSLERVYARLSDLEARLQVVESHDRYFSRKVG